MSVRLNFSRYPYPREIWGVKPPLEVGLKSSLIGVITIIGIATNLIVILLVLRHKKLQCSTNFFVLNFTIASFISQLLFPWMFLCTDLFQNYVLGPEICLIEGFLRVTMMLVIIFSLVFVTFDRLLTIFLPHRWKLQTKPVICMMVSIWIISAAIASPYPTWRTYKERQWSDYLEIWCDEDRKSSGPYWIVLLVVAVWVPLFIMIVFYTAIFVKLSIHASQSSLPTSASANPARIARTIFTLLIAFVVCWVPFTAFILLWHQQYVQIPDWLYIFRFATHSGTYLNMAINPIIYGLQCESFRRILADYLPKKLKNNIGPWTTSAGM